MRSSTSPLLLGLLLVLAGAEAPAARLTPDPWPRELETPEGSTITVYQPQMETLKGDILGGRAAVSVTGKDDRTPRFGVVFFSASVSVDRDDRSVEIRRATISRVRFPDLTPVEEKAFARMLEAEVPRWKLVLSYDQVLESVKVAEREKRSAEGLRNDPPRILFAEEPTVLVTLDGRPQLREVEGTSLKVVLNTPLLMVLDTRSGRYYLSGGKTWWYEADDPTGPWRTIGGPPAEIAALAAKAAEAGKRDGADARTLDEDGTEAARPPRIVVATEPTELIVSEGKPSFKPVAGASADLLSMENTESDVLLDVPSQQYYVRLSGRWFRSKALMGGTWTHVPPDGLPATFADVAPGSRAGEIRASVPGTDEAEDALLDAQIPETRAVKRSGATLDVRYDGEPEFTTVEGTRTEYASNSSASVLRIRGRYYACDDAVWYVADDPGGPWLLADSIPSDELDLIPPSSPVYNVKYVRIYDTTPDEVYFGYTPGYLGAYPWHGTVVWGTGWHYRPWIGSTFWWPRPCTWGFNARYTPWDGWGFGYSWSHPFFSVGFGWGDWFRPSGWGRPSRAHGGRHHSGWFGPGGYRPPHRVVASYGGHGRGGEHVRGASQTGWSRPTAGRRSALAPRETGFRADNAPRSENDLYRRSGERSRDRDVARAPSRDAWRTGTARPNDVRSDRDREIGRRSEDGWQRRGDDGWRKTPGREATRPEPRADRGWSARPAETRRFAPAPRLEPDRGFSPRRREEVRSEGWSRPAPQARSAPEFRPAPQRRPAPEYRPAPPYRSAPQSRPAPEYRSAPQTAPRSEHRSAPERPASRPEGERRRH